MDTSAPARRMTPSSGALPFKFRPRRENVDWRRINAVDIDSVVSQVDVDVLQEHVRAVTFCSLAGERCQRCHSPVDPVLVKLLQLAQLSVEWLLHCQDVVKFNLQAVEERLAAADKERKVLLVNAEREREQLLADATKEREQLLAHQKKQEERLKEMASELKNRKNIIKTQQSMFPSRLIDRQECSHCDKAFLNASSLHGHIQRRHPEQYEKYCRSDKDKKSELQSLENCKLKEQVSTLQQMLQAKTDQENDQQVMYKELLRDFDRFKAEEMVRVDRKLEENRDVIRREMEYLRKDVNQNQTVQHEKPTSPVHSQSERHLVTDKEIEHQLRKQDKKWKTMLQEVKAVHESEKNQLLSEQRRLQLSLLECQQHSQSLQQEMKRRLQEKEQIIKAQREQIRNISSNPPIKVVEVPVLVSAPAPEVEQAPEPKPKRVVVEESVSAPKLEPIQELSEEEKDLSSISKRQPIEKKPVSGKKEKVAAPAHRVKLSLKQEIGVVLEQDVMKRMENLGVRPDQTSFKDKEFRSIAAKMRTQQQIFAKGKPYYWHVRERIAATVDQKMGVQRNIKSRGRSRNSVQVLQIWPPSSSMSSKTSHMACRQAVKQPAISQSAPGSKIHTQYRTFTSNARGASRAFTPNSDEEFKEEHAYMEEGEAPKIRKPSKATGVLLAAKATLNTDDDDEDWSEVSELQEIDPRKLQCFRHEGGRSDHSNSGKDSRVNDLAMKLEKQFAERSAKKPAGGVSILPERKDEVQELSYTDVDESSDWVVSSLEDRQEKLRPGQGSGAAKKSLDSPSTSFWGSSTGKSPKSSLTEAGTGSTLKSSLCFLSDISDSKTISSKHH